MSYIHVDTYQAQRSKRPGEPCGDVIACHRDESSTTLVLSDGIGSGSRANLYAELCTSRLLGLISSGCSIHRAFRIMVDAMNESWGTSDPFAVFSIARILLNGETTVLSYETPDPLLISPHAAFILDGKTSTAEKAVIRESHTRLNPGEGLLLFSDGVSQAGLGNGWNEGWGSLGAARFIASGLAANKIAHEEITDAVLGRSLQIWGKKQGDDISVAQAHCRNGVIVDLLTGPPAYESLDEDLVKAFLTNRSFKIVCGGSTAKMTSRVTGRRISIKEEQISHFMPIGYSIDGIDLVTEGMVSLNQACNILDEDMSEVTEDSPVYELCRLLNLADRVNIYCGSAQNKGERHLMFRQQGLLPRKDILRVLVLKLREKGKLVVMKNEYLEEIL